jgi:hypothetical protein
MRLIASLALATSLAFLAIPRTSQSQETVALEMPVAVLRDIALDFDEGRNPLYCYFARRGPSTPLVVQVDSVTAVATPAQCRGNGLGFVSRIADPAFLEQVLRGLLEGTPDLLVVSAFYRTEDLTHDGVRVHGARALSVIRGVARRSRGSS